jgi:predicted metal-dependent phosphoesterase TrpH
MTESFSKGSEWRRWDLHVHTPESKLENQFTGWEDYISAIEADDSGVAVIGVTDYATIDGYKRLKLKKKVEGFLKF